MTPVKMYMTAMPHTIGRHQTMNHAHDVMRRLSLRHLPVLDGGKLVGVVTERDLHLMETLKGTDPRNVTVDEAMSPDPYTVSPETPLSTVAREMASHKYGCAIVVEGARVVGIFTTVDALRALVG